MIANELYKKYVIDDLNEHKGLYHVVKAPLYERIKSWNVDPRRLHPNPEDEFSMESVGPNWEIVSDYESSIRLNLESGKDIFGEPLLGVKLDRGGYMLINGHHRWMASFKVQEKKGFKYKQVKVPFKAVNVVCDEDISKVLDKSNRDKCITIDLDEVLLVDKSPRFPYSIVYKSNLRENTDLLVREAQRFGFDVWVYTGSYASELYVRYLFAINRCKVDGVVNGLNGKRKSTELKDIFRSKYKTIVHVDNHMITCVDTASKSYEIADIVGDQDVWASNSMAEIKRFALGGINKEAQ